MPPDLSTLETRLARLEQSQHRLATLVAVTLCLVVGNLALSALVAVHIYSRPQFWPLY
jgi:hypothetical protein